MRKSAQGIAPDGYSTIQLCKISTETVGKVKHPLIDCPISKKLSASISKTGPSVKGLQGFSTVSKDILNFLCFKMDTIYG